MREEVDPLDVGEVKSLSAGEVDPLDAGEADPLNDEDYARLRLYWSWVFFCAQYIKTDPMRFFFSLRSLHIAIISALQSVPGRAATPENIFPVYSSLAERFGKLQLSEKNADHIIAAIESAQLVMTCITQKRLSDSHQDAAFLLFSAGNKFFTQGVVVVGHQLDQGDYYDSQRSNAVYNKVKATGLAPGVMSFVRQTRSKTPLYSKWYQESYRPWRFRGYQLYKIGCLLRKFDRLNHDPSASFDDRVETLLEVRRLLQIWLDSRLRVIKRKGRLHSNSRAPAGVALWRSIEKMGIVAKSYQESKSLELKRLVPVSA